MSLTKQNTPRELWRIFEIMLAMSGLRIDRWRQKEWLAENGHFLLFLNAIIFFGITVSSYFIPPLPLASIVCFAIGWTIYYIGNSVVLGTKLRTLWRTNRGEIKALAEYEVLLCFMFQCQGIALLQMASIQLNSLFPDLYEPLELVPVEWRVGIAVAMIMIGLFTKVSATYTAGLDTYFYNDLFLEEAKEGGFIATGIYKWLDSPMYGIGNIHSYGFAVLYSSTPGLIASLVCQLSIYLFNYAIEQPFVKRVYGQQINYQAV